MNHNVTLDLSVQDDIEVTQMMISNDPHFSGAEWEPYSAQKSWTLDRGYGKKEVRVKFRNARGRESATSVASIALEKPMIVTAPGAGGGPQVRVWEWNSNRLTATRVSFMAYDATYRGGVNVAYGDVNSDGYFEIITAPQRGGSPLIKIFDRQGKLLKQFFAYASGFRGGVRVAAGDLDGNGTDEIITSPETGGSPQVRVFDGAGKSKFTPGFFAYPKSFRGGVYVAAGDVNRDGKDEIVTGAGQGGTPQVRVFDQTGRAVSTSGFLAYGKNHRGGVAVATADLDGNGKKEIITVPGQGAPYVRIFNSAGKPTISGGFYAYDKTFRGGVSLGPTDVNGDGRDEVVTGAGQGSSPIVRIFTGAGKQSFGVGAMVYASTFRGGVSLASHSL